VSEIQTTQGRYAGHALVRSYIPKDWTIETNAPEQQANLLCPLTIQVAYASPAQDAFVTFTGTRAYNHLEPTPQNAPMQGQMIQPERMIGLPSAMRAPFATAFFQAIPPYRMCGFCPPWTRRTLGLGSISRKCCGNTLRRVR